jgi:hypothetical protein
MELNRIHILIESFRKEVLGVPQWVAGKHAFEYSQQSVVTVVLLKLIRAAQGLSTLQLLCRAGLFIDMGSSLRGLNECVEEVYFLLETYPEKPSAHVEKFIKNFFEGTIDGYLSITTHQVQRDKIRSACVRVLRGSHDDATQKLLERIYQTFCGYTHAGYANIMEVYDGSRDSFNLDGVPSEAVRRGWAEHFTLACNAVLMAGAFAAQRFGKQEYYKAMMKGVE